MVIGANFTGTRAMTATSGGGFCLMVEALSLAGMTETPAVIIVAQRPGPSTGLPTRTEQADLNFVMHAGHGDFPRVILAPGRPEQAVHLISKAFNLADKYQTPVIVLGDQHFNDAYFTVDELALESIRIDRGHILTDPDLPSPREYKRYAAGDSGISPRILPGQTRAVVYADSDEHTDEGHITESADVRNQMVRKRMQKLEGLRREIDPPEIYPSGQAGLVLHGFVTKTTPRGAISPACNPLLLAIASDCRFVARGFAGEVDHLANLIKEGIGHNGFALIDILQPCVSFTDTGARLWKNRYRRLPISLWSNDRPIRSRF